MAQVTIQSKQEWAKLAKAVLAGGKEVLFFKDAPFADKIVEGATVDMAVEQKPNKDNAAKMDTWVVSVDGVTAKRQGGPGGGGRPMAPPRDEAVIVAQCLFKGAVDVAIHNAATDTKPRQIDPNELKALYLEFCRIFPEGHKIVKAACGA